MSSELATVTGLSSLLGKGSSTVITEPGGDLLAVVNRATRTCVIHFAKVRLKKAYNVPRIFLFTLPIV